jgi:hypothetical protein
MVVVFIIIGILLALGSILAVSNATLGVWFVCLACFLGILARLLQADNQHRALVTLLREQRLGTHDVEETASDVSDERQDGISE